MFPLHLLFIITLVLGSFIAINASSWLIAWVGLEMNLLSFLPLMAGESTKGSTESCVSYFLIQSMASLLILISSVFVFSTFLFSSIVIIFVGLSLKLGAAPFHYWFPSVMEGLNWGNCMILMTWQKVAPFFLMIFVNIHIFIIIMSALIGSLGGFNQCSFKKILAFSSINHVGWMLSGMLSGVKSGIMYFVVYFLMSVLIVITFMSLKLFLISQISVASYFTKMATMINLLSLGGMPPFLGFFPKWFVIEKLLYSSMVLALILIFSSLVSLYFYVRICSPSFLLQFFGSGRSFGGTFYVPVMVALFFFSSGGVFCYPLLSSI